MQDRTSYSIIGTRDLDRMVLINWISYFNSSPSALQKPFVKLINTTSFVGLSTSSAMVVNVEFLSLYQRLESMTCFRGLFGYRLGTTLPTVTCRATNSFCLALFDLRWLSSPSPTLAFLCGPALRKRENRFPIDIQELHVLRCCLDARGGVY